MDDMIYDIEIANCLSIIWNQMVTVNYLPIRTQFQMIESINWGDEVVRTEAHLWMVSRRLELFLLRGLRLLAVIRSIVRSWRWSTATLLASRRPFCCPFRPAHWNTWNLEQSHRWIELLNLLQMISLELNYFNLKSTLKVTMTLLKRYQHQT